LVASATNSKNGQTVTVSRKLSNAALSWTLAAYSHVILQTKLCSFLTHAL